MANEADSRDQSKHTLNRLMGRLQILDATPTVALFDLHRPQLAVGGGGCGTMTSIFHLRARGIRVDADLCAFTQRGFASRYTCGANEGGADEKE